jgi:hypothetical protein
MGAELEGSRAIFSKDLKQIVTHSLPCFLHCSLTSDAQKNICKSNGTKSLNLVNE